MKNNNFRLSKGCVRAILSGVDTVKIGFVSRRDMKNRYGLWGLAPPSNNHMILHVQNYSLNTLNRQLLLNENNMWGIVDFIVKEMSKQENGHYIMMKDPVKGLIRLYQVSDEDLSNLEVVKETEEDMNQEVSSYSDYSSYSSYSDYDD